jgi:hypothetical protein
MGNNQSTANHRLSKPKTNTNSPGPALVNDSPGSVSSRYADLSAKERYQIKETLLSPIDSDFGTAMWSNKDEDAIGELAPRTRGRPMSVASRSNSRTNSRSNSLSCFGSKHGSSTKLTELYGSKLSAISNTQVDLDAAIRLLQEVKRNGSPEDLAALHEALGTPPDTAMSNASPALSRRTSVADGSSLIRRRSLIQTPGVATRNSPVEGRRKTWNSWKTTKLSAEEAAKWAVTPKGITITPVNRLSEESCRATSPRAQTPGEMDYSHLGTLKLGTLSIVNGAPSPAPSAKITKQRPRFGGDVDYFTAAEASSSPLMMKMARRRGHAKSKSSVLPATTLLQNNVTVPEKRQDRYIYDEAQDPQDFDFHTVVESTRSLRVTNRTGRPLSHDASKYAQDYQADIPDSPFASTTTFEREATDGSFRTEDIASLKQEVAQIFAGTVFDAPTTAIETSGSVLFSTAPRISIPEKQVARTSYRPMPRTTDSGYSSGGSLRVSSRNGQDTSPTSFLGRSEGVSDEQATSPVSSQESSLPNGSTQSVLAQAEANAHRDLPALSARTGRPSTSDGVLLPMSPSSVVSKSSFDSTSSSTKKRLQRRQPSHPELPVVQSCHPIPEGTSTIPNIPNNVRANFSRRLSNTPGMECLTHTFPTKHHVVTAVPIVESASVASVEQVVVPLTELEPEQPPTPSAHRRKRSLSLFRRRSTVGSTATDKEDVNASLSIVDLGTIASSLGSSPYDAAMSKPLQKPITSPTHPHQLGGALPRSKSMVSMDSKAAAEFARMRSKDRALGEQEVYPQRRRSYHNLKMEAGEGKAPKRRPNHSMHDIPPVPTIDASKFKISQSVKPRPEPEVEQKVSGLSFSARSQSKGQVVPPLVDKFDQNHHSLAPQKVDWEAHSRLWSERRKTIGNGLHERASLGAASASTVNSRNQALPREDMTAWGRYSGGLDYNYEGRGVGVGGSAGTRSLHSAAAPKSMQWRHQYGVDLSDVPIMLQRA